MTRDATPGQEPAFRARHDLGQNFLRDEQVLADIVASARTLLPERDPREAPIDVIEIGPGTGQLTEALLTAGYRVTALEIDTRLETLLDQRLGHYEHFQLRLGDAADQDLARLSDHEQCPVLGISNLPYYVTTPLITQYLTQLPFASGFIVMVQTDVLTRLRPSRNPSESIKRRGPVQILGEAYGSVDLLRHVPSQDFDPGPRVGSSLLVYRPHRNPSSAQQYYLEHAADFADYLETAFTQRRQTLGKNIRNWLQRTRDQSTSDSAETIEHIFAPYPELATQRAEQLSTEQHLLLAPRFQPYQVQSRN